MKLKIWPCQRDQKYSQKCHKHPLFLDASEKKCVNYVVRWFCLIH